MSIHADLVPAWHRLAMTTDEPAGDAAAEGRAAGEPASAEPRPVAGLGWMSGDDAMPRWVPRAIVLFFVGVMVLVVGQWLLVRLRDLIVTVLISLFVSFALEPAVNRLVRRGWRRGTATGFVFAVFVLAVALFAVAIGKLVVDETSNLIDNAPGYIEDGEAWLNDTFDLNLTSDTLTEQLNDTEGPVRTFLTRAAGNAVGLSFSVLGGIFRLFTVALFVFYLVADGPRFRRVICSFLRPERQRAVLDTWEIAMEKTGGYIYSRGLLALISGVSHWVAFEIIGVPYAIALAVFVGIVSQFIPVVGTYLAAGLPVLIALIGSPLDAVWVLAFATAYQQVENYLLAPRITARTMALHPAVAFGTVIAGAGLLGGIGAVLALPAAAVVQALGSTYIERHEVLETHMTAEPPPRPSVVERLRARSRRREPPPDS